MGNNNNNYMYSAREFKNRKRIIKFLRGSKEKFKSIKNFYTNSVDYINILFEALKYDEDEIVLHAVTKSLGEIKTILTPSIGNDDVYKFLTIIDGIYKMKYLDIIERFYR